MTVAVTARATAAGFVVTSTNQTPNTARVRAMWLAHREARIDDMLGHLHHDIIWWPMSRPGLSRYEGHDGIRQMLADMLAANGRYWIELEDVAEPENNLVRAVGHVVAIRDAGGTPRIAIEIVMTMRGGLIHRVTTQPLSDS